MSGSLLLGIDVGTSATKALVCDERGRVVSSASAEHPISRPRPGWSEQDPPRRPVTHSITLDGVLRESISWFGSDRMHVAGTINDAVLAFRFVYPGRVPNRTTDVMRRLELLADGSLCVTDDNTGPRQPPAIARRVGIGAPTRREIALRTAGDACSVR